MDRELPIKLLSTDFDGTLFAEFEDPPIPLELQQLIAELQKRGAKWVINTGRDMASLMEALGRAGVEIEPDYLVLVEREIHVHQDSRRLSLGREAVFAAGDHLNDLPMLSRQYAQYLAAPANAVEAVKEAVREQNGFVSLLARGEGVADAIKHYLAAPGA